MNEFNPSAVTIEEALIQSYDGKASLDISGLSIKMSLNSSVDAVAYQGSIQIFDAVGLLENNNFKIRGEEKLKLVLKTYDLKDTQPLELNVQVFKVTDIQPSEANDGIVYTLSFISQISYEASKRRIRSAFQNVSASTIAKQLFSKYFGQLSTGNTDNRTKEDLPFDGKKYRIKNTKGKTFYIQPTLGLLKAVIPNYIPTEAMSFLCSKSYSTKSPSCTYRFFETYDGFFYATDEFLIKRYIDNKDNIETFAYNPFNSLDPSEQELQVNTLETFTNPNRIDTSADLFSGGYRSKVIEVDLTRRRVRNFNFDYDKDAKYFDMSGNKRTKKGDVHTPDFIKDTFTEENSKRFLLFKDYYDDKTGSLRANQYYPEIIANRLSYGHHLNNTFVSATTKGRLDLRPGNVIDVIVEKLSALQNEKIQYNEQLSGKYMIKSVTHDIEENILTTSLGLVKYDWSGQYV